VELRGIHAGDTPSRAQVVINPGSSGRLQPSLADFAGALGGNTARSRCDHMGTSLRSRGLT